MNKHEKARRIILQKVQVFKEIVVDSLESGDRAWDVQAESLVKYQELLRTADYLAGYKVEEPITATEILKGSRSRCLLMNSNLMISGRLLRR